MDPEDQKSNLHALKKLYGLLRKDENGLPSSTSDMLDDKSRLVLKDLLDRAAENILKVQYSKVLGDQAGLSSEKAQQQPGDAWMQLSATETSAVLQSCGNVQNEMNYSRLENDCRIKEPRIRKLSVTQPTQIESGNRHKFCRVCLRRIVRHSMEESATCDDTRNEARNTAFTQQNDQLNSIFCGEEKEILISSNRFPVSPRSAKDNRQRGTTYLDCVSSGIGSTDSCSNWSADAVESGPVELNEKTSWENECLYNLTKQASDAIEQIEKRILDLQRGSGNMASGGGSTAAPISSAAQQEQSDKKNDFVPEVESTCDFVMGNPPMFTGNEPSKSEFSATGINDLQQGMYNRQCKGGSPLPQPPCRTRRLPMEVEKPKFTASSPLQSLPCKNTIGSPVSSQTIGRYTGLASGRRQIDMGDPYQEAKRQNQMMDWALGQNVESNVAKLESDYANTSYSLKPSHVHNCSCAWAEDNKIPKMVAASVTCPCQINEEYLHQNQVALEEKIMKPGASQIPTPCRISKDYGKKQNIRAPESRHKSNQFLGSRIKKGFPGETKKWQSPLHYKADQYPTRRIFQHQHESDNKSLSSNSSNWKSQQTSMSYSGSEVYYPSCHIQRWNHVDSPASSENDIYSISGESKVRYQGVSSTENEDYSWQSSDRPFKSSRTSDEREGNSLQRSASSSQVSTTDDSDTEEFSSYNHPRLRHHWQHRLTSVGSTSTKKFRPNGVFVSSKRANPSKRIGRWEKLKDKLSVIFHHHHHHHHHLYHQQHSDDDEDSYSENRKIHGKFPSKRTVKRSHSMRPEAYEARTPEKVGKAVIHNGDNKKQHKPANALIEGLLKHIRHPKGSKPMTKHIKRLREGQHDGNQVSTKLNLLKLLQRHRKAKKLGIGYGKK